MKTIPLPEYEGHRPFDIEDFQSVYTPARKIATLELISQILFFAKAQASKGFGREATGKEIAAVNHVAHSAHWGGKNSTMSASTQRIIRGHLEQVGLFTAVVGLPRWVKGGFKSAVTSLKNLDIKKLCQLARVIFAALVDELGFEGFDLDHHWGGLASIVYAVTGCSLFSMDDDYSPDEAENERRKGERLLQAIAEMGNLKWAGFEYRSIVEKNLRRQFGPNWADMLPY